MNEMIESGEEDESKIEGEGELYEKVALDYAKVCLLFPFLLPAPDECIPISRRRKRPSVGSRRGWNFSRRWCGLRLDEEEAATDGLVCCRLNCLLPIDLPAVDCVYGGIKSLVR
jgi:hypothetical protein